VQRSQEQRSDEEQRGNRRIDKRSKEQRNVDINNDERISDGDKKKPIKEASPFAKILSKFIQIVQRKSILKQRTQKQSSFQKINIMHLYLLKSCLITTCHTVKSRRSVSRRSVYLEDPCF
jgi:hypothetical protein